MKHAKANLAGYDRLAMSLHWLAVILLLMQYILGWIMPHVGPNTLPEGLIFWHVSIGMLLIVVVTVRLAWRIANPVALPRNLPIWEHWIAQITHLMLYFGLFIQLSLGWANASARAWKIELFGIVPLPLILPKASPFGMLAGDIHDTFAIVFLCLIVLHVLAALYHHFVLRDNVLLRMLPGRGLPF